MNTRRRMLLLFSMVVAAAALAGGILLTRVAPAASSVAPPWLQSLAAQVARSNGDAAPTSVRWALTTERAAAPLVGLTAATAPDDGAVYIVVMRGRFTDYLASIPAGASLPTGTCIAFTADAARHTVRDFGISGPIDTSSVGQMQPLRLK
jgi:hypothetical protein